MQKDYHSISFSSASRKSGTPEQYQFTDVNEQNVRQVRLGTLELPHMVQPNVVQGQNNRLAIQEINDSDIVVTGVSNVSVTEDQSEVDFDFKGENLLLTAGGGGNQYRQYDNIDPTLNDERTFQSSARSFIKINSSSFRILLYEMGALDLSKPLYVTDFNGFTTTFPIGNFSTVFSPVLEFALPTSYYSTQELLDHFNTRLNIGFTGGQAQTFRCKKKDGEQPEDITLFTNPGTYRVNRCDILTEFKTKKLPFDFTSDGTFYFDLSDIEYLDFTNSSEALVHMLGVDKTMYFESFSSVHNYYPTCHKYIITETTTENTITLNEPINPYYQGQLILVQQPPIGATKTLVDYLAPQWDVAKIQSITGSVLTLDTGVTTRAGCLVALFPEPRNIYQMSTNTDLKFELLIRLPYQNLRVRIVQTYIDSLTIDYSTTMHKVLGLNDKVVESDETQRLIFPNQYNTDPIPYILMYITNLQGENNHTHISPNGDRTHPLAKIVLQSPFHINRHQIMEMDFGNNTKKINQLNIEFRNPDGSLCFFQGRDHTITLGFVIDRPSLQLTSGALTGVIDPGVRLG